jgi:hypothetical protein
MRVLKQDTALIEIPLCIEFLVSLNFLKPSAKPAANLLVKLASCLESLSGRRILLAWLLLKGRKIELTRFGLDYSLKLTCAQESEYEKNHAVQLLKALLGREITGEEAGGGLALETAFESAACRNFMLVHESGGTEWFSKECFEELLEWLSLIALLENAAHKPAPRTISARLGRLAVENLRLKELAAHAGYRTKLLLRLLEPVALLPAVKGNTAQSKKETGKKADVQSSSRKNTPKTPDHKVPR